MRTESSDEFSTRRRHIPGGDLGLAWSPRRPGPSSALASKSVVSGSMPTACCATGRSTRPTRFGPPAKRCSTRCRPTPEQLGLRKISLRRLEAAIADHRKTGEPLNDEMKYLAGLQHIQYVFVYPELGDIVLAGPGEGWKINAQGDLVGVTTGRPVMWLDDLLVALRTAEATQQTGISCSIDPTDEGVVRVNKLVARMERDGFGECRDIDGGVRDRADAGPANGFDQGDSGRQPFRPRDHRRRLSA